MPQSQGEQGSASEDVWKDRSDAVPQNFVPQPDEKESSRAPATKGIYLKNLREGVFCQKILQSYIILKVKLWFSAQSSGFAKVEKI